MSRLVVWLDRLSRTAYITIVVLATVAFTIIGLLVLKNTAELNDQQDKLETQVERTRRALVYTCETTTTVRELTMTTILLLKSQPPTPARQATIETFQQLLITLQDDSACQEVTDNP
jgi:lysylphosphatidylglycerol synthetase-like protein (DUF2156 family)